MYKTDASIVNSACAVQGKQPTSAMDNQMLTRAGIRLSRRLLASTLATWAPNSLLFHHNDPGDDHELQSKAHRATPMAQHSDIAACQHHAACGRSANLRLGKTL